MTSALTLSTLVFETVYSDKTGSLRQELSRGVSLPTKVLIRNQEVTDSATKLQAVRSSVRFEYHAATSTGIIAPIVTATLTVQKLKDTAVTSAIVVSTTKLVGQLFPATNTGGLDLVDEIFVNQEQ